MSTVQLTQREELLITADRLRQQATRLRQNAQWADSRQARENDERDARDCITRAEQMESDAAGMPIEQLRPFVTFDLIGHLERQKEFSLRTFGPDYSTERILRHIAKESDEVRDNPLGLEEWIDLVLLACDGALRAGHSPLSIVMGLHDKLAKNETRIWPDWRTVPDHQPIEHVKTETRVDCGECPNVTFGCQGRCMKEIPAFLRKEG